MDLFGVGPLELIFLLLIIFLVLGPKDIQATGKKIGTLLNSVQKSEIWRSITIVTSEMRDLPTTLIREAELEDTKQELEQDLADVRSLASDFEQGELEEVKQEFQASELIEENDIAHPVGEETLPDETGDEDQVD